jgi:penicillin-binding protein 1A
MQSVAHDVFKTEMIRLRKEYGADIDGGLIVIDRKNGEIKALIGGFDFGASKWNRVTQAHRQIGSLLKPLVYAAAIAKGMTFADTDIDEPFELIQNNTIWAPKNYNKRFNGQITLAYALSHSNNIVSIKTFLRVGAQPIIDLAKKCRLQGAFHAYPSLALGCVDATLCEAVGMFNVFANDGVYVEPHALSWVKNRWGARIYKTNPESERVMASRIVGQVASVLCLGPERMKFLYGINNWIKPYAMSKTGTTNDSRTCWFVGSTPTLTTAIYVGFDDNRSMGKNVFPIKTALPIWVAFNRAIDQTEAAFSYDPSLREIVINEYTGESSFRGQSGAISILV